MQLSNKIRRWWDRPRTGAGWLGALAAVLLLAACSKTTNNLNDDLPAPAAVNRAAFYTDTITVRSSTVLLDSVNSSSQTYLLTGRYVDPLLGTVQARSYAEFNLDAVLAPDPTQVYDSLVLVLKPNAYHYGDTTQVQQVEVHQIVSALRLDKPYYTKDDVPYGATVLGRRSYRSNRALTPVRVPLNNGGLGLTLWNAIQAGKFATQDEDQLRVYLAGLVLLPGAADNGTIQRWAATPVLTLYHHAINDPATPLSNTFTTGNSNPRFFHLEADRSRTALAGLTTPGQALSSKMSGNRTFVEAGLGVCTKLEFPYLSAFNLYGTSLILNSANVQIIVPTSTESNSLPFPALAAQYVNRVNHPLTAYPGAVAQSRFLSPRTNLDQDTYTLSVLTYIQQVIAGTITNDGLLLNPGALSASAVTVNRAVLGSTASTDAPLQLQIYYTRVTQ